MNGESATAPTRPPPGPGTGPPLFGVFGNCASLQQALASAVELPGSPSASSNVIRRRPSRLNAADPVILGTQVCRNESAATSPPGPPSAQLPGVPSPSCPSLHRSGVMKLKLGVLFVFVRSPG